MARVSKDRGDQFYLLHPNKTGTMRLPVPIDEAVTARLNARMAAITSERLEKESEKKRVLEPINKRLSELRISEQKLDAERKSGQTEAEVEVQERANFEEGCAWMVRVDTGMEVPNTRRQLTQAERQSFAAPRGDDDPERLFARRGEDATEDEDEDDEAEDGDEGAEAADDDAIPFGDPAPVPIPDMPALPGDEPAPLAGGAVTDHEGDRIGTLYRASSHEGWGFYVHQGHVYFRPPNVDSFEPAGRPGDHGPFAWKAKDKMLDALPSAQVDDAWMGDHARLLEDADRSVNNGTVKEKVAAYPEESPASAPASPAPAQATETPADSAPAPTGEPLAEDAVVNADTGGDLSEDAATELAKKLSDSARKVMRFLGTVKSADTTVIGNTTSTKAGAVVPTLMEKAFVERAPHVTPAHYALTKRGRQVLAALLETGKKRTPSTTTPAPSAVPDGDVPH